MTGLSRSQHTRSRTRGEFGAELLLHLYPTFASASPERNNTRAVYSHAQPAESGGPRSPCTRGQRLHRSRQTRDGPRSGAERAAAELRPDGGRRRATRGRLGRHRRDRRCALAGDFHGQRPRTDDGAAARRTLDDAEHPPSRRTHRRLHRRAGVRDDRGVRPELRLAAGLRRDPLGSPGGGLHRQQMRAHAASVAARRGTGVGRAGGGVCVLGAD